MAFLFYFCFDARSALAVAVQEPTKIRNPKVGGF
jgi:hypothetical protein